MNDETNEIFGIEINGATQNVSLADLAGLDMTNVEAYRGGDITPQGVFEWRLAGTELGTITYPDKKTGEDVTKATIDFQLEAIACRQVKDPALSPEDLTGITHYERFFISDLLKDMGRVQAFLEDMGREGGGPLSEMLDAALGHEFVCAIKHRKDRNDPDRVYANVDFKTVEPLAATAVAAQPAAAAAIPASGIQLMGGGQ